MTRRAAHDEVGERLDRLVADLEDAGGPTARAIAEEAIHLVVDYYGQGLTRLVELLVADTPAGRASLERLAGDELVSSLLVLHDLHPVDVGRRVEVALDSVRPYLGSHAGGVELVGIGPDGVVHLRLGGTCDGCPSSALTVQSAIEGAIRAAAPELAGVEVEGVVAAPGPEGRTLLPLCPAPASPVPT